MIVGEMVANQIGSGSELEILGILTDESYLILMSLVLKRLSNLKTHLKLK